MPLATFEGSIRVGQEKAAVAEEITLTFAYVDETVGEVGQSEGVAVSAARPRDVAGGQPPLAAASVAAS
jgi:3-hydroxyacyl-[acyl-carrier-protein] dehydratase